MQLDELGASGESPADDLEQEENTFDKLSWEVECTAEVWKKLKDRSLEPPVKKRIISKIKVGLMGL